MSASLAGQGDSPKGLGLNLQQLRIVRETVRRGFNLTEAARSLFTSQPGLSKAIGELEKELGFRIFERQGKRLTGLTVPGREVADRAQRALLEIENLRQIGADYAQRDHGELRVAATHTQARYSLPPAIARFRKRYPQVRLALMQGSPPELVKWLKDGECDVAMATESVSESEDLIAIPAYRWEHSVITLHDHPLATAELTLAEIARYPLLTYSEQFAGRRRIDAAFKAEHLRPDVVLEAIDSDVIKTYVQLGLGVGIVASVAVDPERDRDLTIRPAGVLFGQQMARLAVRSGAYLPGFTVGFIEAMLPDADPRQLRRSLGLDERR